MFKLRFVSIESFKIGKEMVYGDEYVICKIWLQFMDCNYNVSLRKGYEDVSSVQHTQTWSVIIQSRVNGKSRPE